LRIPTLLTIPRHSIDALENLPAVMLPHGGPAAHDSIGFDWFAQALADEGYLVIQPQYRGSTGFGLDHRAAGDGEWGRKMQSDLSDGLASLVAKGYVDPARVCIVGMSYGGYAALAGGAFQPDLWRCVVSINGVADLNRMVDHDAFWSDDSRMTKQYIAHTLGVDGIDRKYRDSISPSEHAEAFTVPVLLILGEDDEIVSIGQSKAMRSRLDRADKEVVFIKLPDAGHGLRSYESRVRTVRETVDFVNRHLAASP
jgi:dipeptidyl aminopeptidase/acylaminoacyl peptidase